jgi:hypothetical protein
MLLTVKERILLLQVLPKEGDFLTQKIVRDLRSKAGLSEEDWKTYNIRTMPDGRVEWDATKDKGTEIPVGDKAKEIICDALKDLDKQKKVTDDFMPMFDKFLPNYEGVESKK